MSLNHSQEQDPSAIAEIEPWPLATNAVLRVLAWPKYDDTESLKRVLMVAEPLFNNQAGCLCLRHDPNHDIPYEEAVRQLELAFGAMDLSGDLEVLFINEALEKEDWSRLGKSVTAVIQVDNVLDEHRQSFINTLAKDEVEIIGVTP